MVPQSITNRLLSKDKLPASSIYTLFPVAVDPAKLHQSPGVQHGVAKTIERDLAASHNVTPGAFARWWKVAVSTYPNG